MKQLWNEAWILNPADGYEMFLKQDPVKKEYHVTLPYDALQLEKRNANVPLGKNTGYYPYEKATYVKRFEVPKSWENRLVSVEFEGVYRNAMVYVNDEFAGSCPHGYTDFTIDMTPFLKIGKENELKVLCKMNRDSRWYPGLGIYRNVYLYVKEPVHIAQDGIKITTEDITKGAVLTVETEVENRTIKTAYTRILTTIRDADGRKVAEESSTVTVYGNQKDQMRQRLFITDAKLWDTEHPYLYQVYVQLIGDDTAEEKSVSDTWSCAYGIRQLTLNSRDGLCINGKRILLRGACIHHDNGLIGAAAIVRAEERRVQLLKKAGFNAVRSAHNPISKAFLDACDKYGMLVMDELTDMWTHQKGEWDYSTEFVNHWQELCRSVAAKDYNHCSVIMYSIGNEIHETGSHHGAVIGRKLAKKMKRLDPTRYTTNSVNLMMASQGKIEMQDMLPELLASGMDLSVLAGLSGAPSSENSMEGSDRCQKKETDINEIMKLLGPLMAVMVSSDAVGTITEETFSSVDIAGYNYAASRYEKDGKRYQNRVIVGSETFPQEIAGNWELVKKLPHVIGDFTWTGWDYIGEAGIGATNYEGEETKEKYPWYLAWCGDIDITGVRRPVSYYREIVYGLRKDPYFAVRYPQNYGKTRKNGSWDFVDGCTSWTWPSMEGKEVELEVYAPGDQVTVTVNGTIVAETELKEYKGLVKILYEPGEIVLTAYERGIEIGTYSMCTAGAVSQIEAVADRTVIKADTTDLCYVEISLTDSDGRRNPASDREVTVKVEGAGYLAGFGSAKPTSEESFLSGSFQSYQGHLLAIIRPTRAGQIGLTVSSEGLEDAKIWITAVKKEEQEER